MVDVGGGPFAGVRVLEACEEIAGPLAGMLLADLGAEVIKVERGAGDPLRGEPAFHTLNRSKQSLAIGTAWEAVAELAPHADVLLIDRTVRIAAAGCLDAESLRARAPRLIHCSISGFGERGRLRDLPPDDGLVAAVSA